ncbi:MAG: ATP-binding cassette domain-containing protein, partial [Candidatus Kapabacteria bacterium]|nr:ATP-binding cassette domain-containing protein [Candidatus Kapabacteria bacterium]
MAVPSPLVSKIRTRELNVYYGHKHALQDVTVEIYANRVTAFIGPSGCGKSTFLRALNRMNELIPNARTTGRVEIDGVNIYDPSVDIVQVRRRVGMVFQQSVPFPKSIYENVAFGLRLNGKPTKSELDAIVEASLRRAALWDEV